MTRKSVEEIRTWLMEKVAYLVAVSPDELDIYATFDTYGLGSREAIGLSGDIEDWLGVRLAPSILYQYTTIDSLARHLATLEPQKNQEGESTHSEKAEPAGPVQSTDSATTT